MPVLDPRGAPSQEAAVGTDVRLQESNLRAQESRAEYQRQLGAAAPGLGVSSQLFNRANFNQGREPSAAPSPSLQGESVTAAATAAVLATLSPAQRAAYQAEMARVAAVERLPESQKVALGRSGGLPNFFAMEVNNRIEATKQNAEQNVLSSMTPEQQKALQVEREMRAVQKDVTGKDPGAGEFERAFEKKIITELQRGGSL